MKELGQSDEKGLGPDMSDVVAEDILLIYHPAQQVDLSGMNN